MSMTVRREELDRREIDFSDVASGRQLAPVHPGEILRDEFLTPMGISVYRLAHAINVSRPRLTILCCDAVASPQIPRSALVAISA